MTEIIFEEKNAVWLFILVHVPSTNTEEAGFITYTAGDHAQFKSESV